MATECSLFYGAPGSGKSTAMVEEILRTRRDTGKKSLVYMGDGGSCVYELHGLVRAGLVTLVDYTARTYPLTQVHRMTQGWLPSGDSQSELVAPKGGWAGVSQDHGLVIYEGLSVMAAYAAGSIEGGLAWRGAKGEKIGQDSPISIVDPSGLKVGGNPIAHYNVIQQLMRTAIKNSNGFPGRVLWSAHERPTEDQGEKLVGPEVFGKAMTATIAREFTHTLHFTTADCMKKVKDPFTGKDISTPDTEFRIYTRDHYAPDANTYLQYKAVTRCAVPASLPLYVKSPDTDPGAGIRQFYQILAKIEEQFLTTQLGEQAPTPRS